jgi:hypothetical protein
MPPPHTGSKTSRQQPSSEMVNPSDFESVVSFLRKVHKELTILLDRIDKRAPQKRPGGEGTYTLAEVSQQTGISLPTLQRYKREHQARIPSVGTARQQRYPESALPVFQAIKSENKRGRPVTKYSAAPTKRGARTVAAAAKRPPTPLNRPPRTKRPLRPAAKVPGLTTRVPTEKKPGHGGSAAGRRTRG